MLPDDVVAIIRHFGGPLSATRNLAGEVHRLWRQSTQGMLCPQPPWPEAVCIEFRRRIDDAIRAEHGGTLPWQRHVAIGDIDYFTMHALLLDRIDEVLIRLLPVGRRCSGATWRGRRTSEAPEITVCSGKRTGDGRASAAHHIMTLSDMPTWAIFLYALISTFRISCGET